MEGLEDELLADGELTYERVLEILELTDAERAEYAHLREILETMYGE